MYASTYRQQILTAEARHAVRERAARTAALASAKALMSAALHPSLVSCTTLYAILNLLRLPHLQAVDPGEAEFRQLAREAATRAAALAALETLLWGSRAPCGRRARPTLGQRLARAAAGALLAGFAVELEDVVVTLGGAAPADREPGAGQPGQPSGVQIIGEGWKGAAGGVVLRVPGLTLEGGSRSPCAAGAPSSPPGSACRACAWIPLRRCAPTAGSTLGVPHGSPLLQRPHAVAGRALFGSGASQQS